MDSLQEERSDWLAQRRQVQAELERTSEERASERGEHAAKVQELNEQLQLQSKVSAVLPPAVQTISVTTSQSFMSSRQTFRWSFSESEFAC